jgi:hypothetical protein
MLLNVGKEVAALERMTVKDLQARYADAFGEETLANNKSWLVKRIAWRLQALAEGDLSERARQRAAELANDADLRTTPPKLRISTAPAERTKTGTLRIDGDRRLPPPGSVLTRTYKGQTLRVTVLPTGFEFEGDLFKSLSAVAKAVTGQHCNGYHFFRLGTEGDR